MGVQNRKGIGLPGASGANCRGMRCLLAAEWLDGIFGVLSYRRILRGGTSWVRSIQNASDRVSQFCLKFDDSRRSIRIDYAPDMS